MAWQPSCNVSVATAVWTKQSHWTSTEPSRNARHQIGMMPPPKDSETTSQAAAEAADPSAAQDRSQEEQEPAGRRRPPEPRPEGEPSAEKGDRGNARPTRFSSAMLEHLKETAAPIRISYTRTKYLVHLALILVVAWETLWLLSRVARRRPPTPAATALPLSASSLSAASADHLPPPWFSSPTASTPPWLMALTASSPLSKAYTALLPLGLLAPQTSPLLRLLVPSCYLSVLSGTLLQHLVTLFFTLTYLLLGLVSSLTYAPLMDKITHVYLVWPFNYLVLDSLLAARRGAAFFGHPMPAGRGPDDLSCTQTLLPVLASVVYHVYLRRTLVAVRLWQHSRSFPHRHALAHQQGIALGLVALKSPGTVPLPAPGVHPHAHLASQVRQVLYRAYTLMAPYVTQWCLRHVLVVAGQQEVEFPLGWVQVSPLVCVASWAMLKLFVSFYCFQVECLVWTPGAIGKEGVLVWRGQRDGWRAGVFE